MLAIAGSAHGSAHTNARSGTRAGRTHLTICDGAFVTRRDIIARFGPGAPGRNICRFGIQTRERPRGKPRRATFAERVRYFHALQQLEKPAPAYLAVYAGAPHVGPAGTLTAHYKPIGLAACIVRVESDGDPQASNGSHWGVAQWDETAWHVDGGGRFSASPLGATLDEQLLVLSDGLVKYGCRQWCPFDPC